MEGFIMKTIKYLKKYVISAVILWPCISTVGAAELIKLRLNVQEEKHNIAVNFSKSAIASIGVDASIINGFSGVTSDFSGHELPLNLLFQTPLSENEIEQFSEFQFRLKGIANCQLVQKGNSPDIPTVKVAILAQNCKLVSVTH